MSSREEFLRSLGISSDDVKDPSAVKSKYPSRASDSEKPAAPKKGYASYSEEFKEPALVLSPKKDPPVQRAAPLAAAQNDARAQFLRSLGIDNMDEPHSATATQVPRATQEIVNSRKATGSIERESRPRSNVSFDSVGSQEGSKSFAPAVKPDITLGHPKRTHSIDVCPEADGLNTEEIKNLGNRYFEEGDFRKAIRLYTRAIEKDGNNGALFSNRSACYLQAAKQMGIDTRVMALRDADKAIELRPDWFKGYSRRGDALFKLERYSEAAVAYERGLALEPNNVNLMHSLGEARNAAGQVKMTANGSWSTASQNPESLRSAAHKSAFELLEEMKKSVRSQSSEALVGNDYKNAELAKFRHQKSMETSHTSSATFSSVSFVDDDDTPRAPPKLDKSKIEEQFSSQAAAAYQQNLLDQYRKKKAAQATSKASRY